MNAEMFILYDIQVQEVDEKLAIIFEDCDYISIL